MYINTNQAKTYYKNQPNYKEIYGKMKLCGLTVLIPILGLIIYPLITTGYMLVLANKRIFMPNSSLADWQTGKIIQTGLCWLGYSFLIGILATPITSFINYSLLNPENLSPMLFVSYLLYIIVMMIADAAVLVYSTNLKFSSFFKLKAIKYILVDKFADYIKFATIRFLITFCYTLLIMVSIIIIVGPFLLIPKLMFVMADLNAQFVRKVFKIAPKELKG